MLLEAPVTHAEFLEQVEAYALGALEADQTRAMSAHLAESGAHPECETALRRAQDAVAALASDLSPVEPPPRVWRAIAGSIGAAPGPAAGAGLGLRTGSGGGAPPRAGDAPLPGGELLRGDGEGRGRAMRPGAGRRPRGSPPQGGRAEAPGRAGHAGGVSRAAGGRSAQ